MSKSTDRRDYEQAASPLGLMPKDYPDGFTVGWHAHERGQLIHAVSGLMKVRTADGFWLVPPLHALWMPPGLMHDMQACGPVALRTLYVDSTLPALPSTPKALGVSPLMRELIARASTIPINYDLNSHEGKLLEILWGEVRLASAAADFHLKPASDKRLARVCDALVTHPGNARELAQWASVAGCSSRTLARLFTQEFGLPFSAWRQQVRLMASLPRLARGETVTSVALDLGYDTPSAFSEVFRRWLGSAPSGYFGKP